MLKNWSSGAERLATAARAAGFAMATPDDRPDDVPSPAPQQRAITTSGWTSATPRALVVLPQRPASYQSGFRDWMSSLIWRAPA